MASSPLIQASPASRSKRLLAFFCALLLVISTLPLYVISLFNHPYYDDYNFSADVHHTWKETGSFTAVLQTTLRSAQAVRQNWQGTYTGTLLSNLQPGVFSESLYFLTTFFLLTVFLLCFGFFLKVVFKNLLGLDGAETVILVSLALTLLVQFMPDPDEAFFWFNGGVGNTFIYSLLALSLGLCVKLERCRGKGKRAFLIAALLLLMIPLGGGSYGGGIFGLLIYALLSLWGFARKRSTRFVYPILFLVFLFCFLYSISAPGNAVRAGFIGFQGSPIKAVFQAFYYGIAVGTGYVRLPLLAVTALLVPFFVRAVRRLPYRFSHPWLVLGAGVCLFCAPFAPPLYSGVGIGGGRIVDTYYQSFTVLWLLYACYLTGWVVQHVDETRLNALLPATPRARRALLLTCCCGLFIGCLAYKRPTDATYGFQNMAGGSATLSLLRGEAIEYDRQMAAREVLLNDDSQPIVTLAPLTMVPEIFMKDLLAEGAVYNVRPALCTYYDKSAILIAGEEDR